MFTMAPEEERHSWVCTRVVSMAMRLRSDLAMAEHSPLAPSEWERRSRFPSGSNEWPHHPGPRTVGNAKAGSKHDIDGSGHCMALSYTTIVATSMQQAPPQLHLGERCGCAYSTAARGRLPSPASPPLAQQCAARQRTRTAASPSRRAASRSPSCL